MSHRSKDGRREETLVTRESARLGGLDGDTQGGDPAREEGSYNDRLWVCPKSKATREAAA